MSASRMLARFPDRRPPPLQPLPWRLPLAINQRRIDPSRSRTQQYRTNHTNMVPIKHIHITFLILIVVLTEDEVGDTFERVASLVRLGRRWEKLGHAPREVERR